MSNVYTGWFDGWQNARQRQAIEELDSELSSLSSSLSRQRRESSQLRSQLSQLQGNLEQKVERLASSLSALVELTDVQMVLAMFDPPALVRHRARDAVTICEAGKVIDALPPFPDDVPDYWLGPAVQALVALVRGEEPGDLLATAEQRDRRRTAMLLTCGLVLAGRDAPAQRWFGEALGPLVAEVPATHAQRTLWTVAVAGRFGAAGKAALRERLTELVSGLTPERERAEAAAWADLVAQLSGGSAVRLPSGVPDDGSVQRAIAAGGRLATLRKLCEPAPAATDGATLDEPSREALTGVLHALVDEGTADEAPLLRRAAELRATVEHGVETSPLTGWDDDAGSPCDLLRSDAFDPMQPELAELAQQTGRRWLLAAAADLAEQASATPPAEVTVTIGGDQLRVRPEGGDGWDLSRVRNEIEQRPMVDPRAGRLALWLAIGGGVLCLPVVFFPNGLAILSVLAGIGLLIAAGARWQRERRSRQDRASRKQADLAHLERSVTKAASEFADLHRQVAEATERAAEDMAAIRGRFS